jgi:hypothetical protein
MTKRLLPKHISGTAREWRLKKRAELRSVQRALSVLQMGCAYTPISDFGKVWALCEQWKVDLRGNWKP